jgi:hypothetical protein
MKNQSRKLVYRPRFELGVSRLQSKDALGHSVCFCIADFVSVMKLGRR